MRECFYRKFRTLELPPPDDGGEEERARVVRRRRARDLRAADTHRRRPGQVRQNVSITSSAQIPSLEIGCWRFAFDGEQTPTFTVWCEVSKVQPSNGTWSKGCRHGLLMKTAIEEFF